MLKWLLKHGSGKYGGHMQCPYGPFPMSHDSFQGDPHVTSPPHEGTKDMGNKERKSRRARYNEKEFNRTYSILNQS